MFVITSMPVGGAETLLVNMMRRMDANRIVPEVACLKEPGPLAAEIASEFTVHSDLLAAKWDLRVLPRLVRLMHQRRIDAVITVGAGDKMFWGRLAAHIAGVPAIGSALHSTGWPDGVGRLNRWLTRITDSFIAVADSHGEFLSDFEKFPSDKVQVIRNGVDCDRFCPDRDAARSVREELGLAADTPLIGIVAALRSEKNHSMLVHAAAKVRDEQPNAHWLVIGDGPERATIEKLSDDLKLNDRIHFLGTRHDTPRLVSALDVFTLCSLNEAFPVSILEALACQVPVVATDVGSVRESILDGVTGFLIPSQDIHAMASCVSKLIASPEQRESLGKAGRELVLQSGSLQSMVEGYENLVSRLYDQQAKRYAQYHQRAPAEIARLRRSWQATPLRK
ncbi:MAG: glycosyltransferase [Pirellulaceae bacterium]|nr:glycosyltransferase [Pirellulaceae bacterium]